MPRSEIESRQNVSRYGSSALMSGTDGCTSQSMAFSSAGMASIHLEVGLRRDVAPLRDLRAQEIVELIRRRGLRIDAERLGPRGEFGRGDDDGNVSRDLVEDR